jgi:long-chain alkane monooxygenase
MTFHLGLFTMAPSGHSAASWRHPRHMSRGYDPFRGDTWAHVGQVAERGRFDFLFAADSESIGNVYAGSHHGAVRYGSQTPTFDQSIVLTWVAAATQHLGVIATQSILGSQPYLTARRFATLDHLSGGRAGLNIVTGGQGAAARNLGLDGMYSHTERYARADEYLALCNRLWASWDEDAIIRDAASGHFADADKVHSVDFAGQYFRSPGPLNVPRPPQGRPVIAQAGGSPQGIAFGGKHAEVLFSVQPTAARMRVYRDRIRQAAADAGRDPDTTKTMFAVQPFVAESRDIAHRELELHNERVSPEAGLVVLSSVLGEDLSRFSADTPASVLAELDVPGGRGGRETFLGAPDNDKLTLGDVGRLQARSVGAPQVAGTPADIADWMEAAMSEAGGDGFMITAPYLPGGLEAFVDLAIPELQRRGLIRREYEGSGHLRDQLLAF